MHEVLLDAHDSITVDWPAVNENGKRRRPLIPIVPGSRSMVASLQLQWYISVASSGSAHSPKDATAITCVSVDLRITRGDGVEITSAGLPQGGTWQHVVPRPSLGVSSA